jgi:RimJ/RimL family protein N-acetyltransferase
MASADAMEGEIGFELDPSHWGQGYATEAVQAVLDFGFTQLSHHRIWSWCIADNIGSARVLEKVGMQREGRQREVEFFKGRWWDRLLYAILDYEWSKSSRAG